MTPWDEQLIVGLLIALALGALAGVAVVLLC
jgi:hypothetical protein